MIEKTGQVVIDSNESIPRIVHRTVPKLRTRLMEECWESVIEHTKDWVHMTHEDDDQYEIVGPYLNLCKKGAFRADLIRLEALYKYGGVYLDSDVKLFRSIEPLLNNKMFVALEKETSSDRRLFLMNAVMGTIPNNSIIRDMIELSIDILKRDGLEDYTYHVKYDIKEPKDGPNSYGPYVVDAIGMKYDEISKLSPKAFQTFYPDLSVDTDLLKNDSEVYGRHMYVGSWLAKEDTDKGI